MLVIRLELHAIVAKVNQYTGKVEFIFILKSLRIVLNIGLRVVVLLLLIGLPALSVSGSSRPHLRT